MQDPITTTVTLLDGTALSLDLHRDNSVTLWRVEGGGRIWSGDGRWTGERLSDCEADFSDDDYDEIDEALEELDRRGI